MNALNTGFSAVARQQVNNALAADPAGLHELRRQAKEDDAAGLEAAARAFEALLLGQMLKQMRSASLGDGLFDSAQSELYRDMHDQEIARIISEGQGLGIREALMRQLGGARSPDSRGAPDPAELAVPERNPWLRSLRKSASDSAANSVLEDDAALARAAGVTPAAAPVNASDWPPATPEAFLRVLKPQAEAAAAKLGFDPLVLLAQSALETGWGRRIPRRANGVPSYNLFGIKAHGGWTGERVSVGTLEYRNGVAQREQAQFRAYSTPAESFMDYVDFLRHNPRYRHALASDNSREFVRGLQRAGYATDPQYANKILSIHDRLRSMAGEAESQELASASVTAKKG